MDLLNLLHEALAAGLTLAVRSGRLCVRGPESAAQLVRALGERKEEVISILEVVPALTGATSYREPIRRHEEPHVKGPCDLEASASAPAEAQRRWRCLSPYCRQKGRWWKSAQGVVNCGHCVPPAFPDLVVAEGDARDAPFVEPDRSNQAVAALVAHSGPGRDAPDSQAR